MTDKTKIKMANLVREIMIIVIGILFYLAFMKETLQTAFILGFFSSIMARRITNIFQK